MKNIKKKKLCKKILIVMLIFLILLTNTTYANTYYKVAGNSMSPTLEDGQVISVNTSNMQYKEGDIVVAELENEKSIIKRVKGDMLLGDNSEVSKNYKISNVKIIGILDKIGESNGNYEDKELEQVFAFDGTGDGSPSNPWKIYSVEQMSWISGGLLDQHFILMNDIDLSSLASWTPIGTSGSPFSGSFDGNGKTITTDKPIFLYIENARVENLNIRLPDSDVIEIEDTYTITRPVHYYNGSYPSSPFGSTFYEVVGLLAVSARGNVDLVNIDFDGENREIKTTSNISFSPLIGSHQAIAGAISNIQNVDVRNLKFRGDNFGGVVVIGGTPIQYTSGESSLYISRTSVNNINILERSTVGGLVAITHVSSRTALSKTARVKYKFYVSECYVNMSTVYSTESSYNMTYGGILGRLHDSFHQDYAMTGYYPELSVQDSFVIGNTSQNTTVAAGLIGTVRKGNGTHKFLPKMSVKNCYFLNKPYTATNKTKAIMTSSYYSPLTVENSYYDHTITGITPTTTLDSEMARITFQMKRQSNYEGWDFNNVWAIDEGNSYPILRNLPLPSPLPDFLKEHYSEPQQQIGTPQNIAYPSGTEINYGQNAKFRWDKVQDATGYRIEYNNGDSWSSDWESIGGTVNIEEVATDRIEGTIILSGTPQITENIKFRVIAIGDSGDSEPSMESSEYTIVKSNDWSIVEMTELESKTANIELDTRGINFINLKDIGNTAIEYGIKNGEDINFQSTREFTGLTPNTEYEFFIRYKETATHNASDYRPQPTGELFSTLPSGHQSPQNIDTDIPADIIVGSTIKITWQTVSTAEQYRIERQRNTGEWTQIGLVDHPTNEYNYTIVTEDAGKELRFRVISIGQGIGEGISDSTDSVVIDKLNQNKPNIPILEEISTTEIKLSSNVGTKIVLIDSLGNKIEKNTGSIWDVVAGGNYTAYAYYPETTTHKKSSTSGELKFTLEMDKHDNITGEINYPIKAKYEDSIEISWNSVANTDKYKLEYSVDSGISWIDITETTNNTYSYIINNTNKMRFRVKAIRNGYLDSNYLEGNHDMEIELGDQAVPLAPTLNFRTNNSITLNAITNGEYSIDNGLSWQDSTLFDGLNQNTEYTFVQRYKETETHSASPNSLAATFKTIDDYIELEELLIDRPYVNTFIAGQDIINNSLPASYESFLEGRIQAISAGIYGKETLFLNSTSQEVHVIDIPANAKEYRFGEKTGAKIEWSEWKLFTSDEISNKIAKERLAYRDQGHYITTFQYKNDSNVESKIKEVETIVDFEAPTGTIAKQFSHQSAVSGNSISIRLDVTDNLSNTLFAKINGTWKKVEDSFFDYPLDNKTGPQTIEILVADMNGNRKTLSESIWKL